MNRYVIYNKTTGHIESVLQLSDKSKALMQSDNPDTGFYLGTVADVNKYRMNVSTDTHTIESKPTPTINIEQYIRDLRSKYLMLSDWTQAADSPLTDTKKAEWANYRQQLRDLPADAGSYSTIDDIVWPTKP
tara:strand:- start:3269 stop:3664 length:396 start_codon:yes stop_codon:yes gene_type:complete